MPTFNVTLKENAPESALADAKQKAKDQGGSIEHEFTLIKGFTVKYPDDCVTTLETNENITVEEDKEMRIQ